MIIIGCSAMLIHNNPSPLGHETSHIQNFRGLGCGHHEASIFNQSTHIPCICLHTWLLIQFNYFHRNYFYAILFWREHISCHIVPLQRAFICSDISASCCDSVTDYPTLSNPMECSTIDLTVLNYFWSLLKLVSIESWCDQTTSSSATLFSLAFNLSQHQCFFYWVSCSHQAAKGLELQL